MWRERSYYGACDGPAKEEVDAFTSDMLVAQWTTFKPKEHDTPFPPLEITRGGHPLADAPVQRSRMLWVARTWANTSSGGKRSVHGSDAPHIAAVWERRLIGHILSGLRYWGLCPPLRNRFAPSKTLPHLVRTSATRSRPCGTHKGARIGRNNSLELWRKL